MAEAFAEQLHARLEPSGIWTKNRPTHLIQEVRGIRPAPAIGVSRSTANDLFECSIREAPRQTTDRRMWPPHVSVFYLVIRNRFTLRRSRIASTSASYARAKHAAGRVDVASSHLVYEPSSQLFSRASAAFVR